MDMVKALLICLSFATLISCTSFLYFPSKIIFDNPKRHHLDKEEHIIKTSDNINLHSWLLTSSKQLKKTEQKMGLVLQYHGNAENMSSHYNFLAWIAHHGYDLLTFDYRGYGQSEGQASVKGLTLDSQAALDFALKIKKERGYKKLIIIGQSLGGSLLLKTLSDTKNFQKEIDLVILDSSFRSNSAVGAAILRKSWITFLFSPLAYVLMHDTYNAQISDLSEWHFATLCVAHKHDHIVPSYLTQDIFNSLKNARKKWLWIRDDEFVGHTNSFLTPEGPLNEQLLQLLKKEI